MADQCSELDDITITRHADFVEALQIALPVRVMFARKLIEHVPRIPAAVVPVVEHPPHRVAPDRLDTHAVHPTLAPPPHRPRQSVPTHLGPRRAHPPRCTRQIDPPPLPPRHFPLPRPPQPFTH